MKKLRLLAFVAAALLALPASAIDINDPSRPMITEPADNEQSLFAQLLEFFGWN